MNLLYRKDIFDVYQRVLGKDELDQNKFCELMLDQLGDQQYVAEDGLTYLANVEIVYNYNTFYFTTLIQAVCPENRGGSYDLDRSIDPHSDICEAADQLYEALEEVRGLCGEPWPSPREAPRWATLRRGDPAQPS